MAELDPLIYDLALILASAGLVTIIFKFLKQPVVLGYIVVGVMAGPHFDFFPTIVEEHSIHIWAEIGIVFLLFSLGLEFSFKKLMRLGSAISVTALIFITSMMLLGFSAGHLLGWTQMNCIFLAGMVAMSSTTIIIKAVTDLGMRKQKSTELVFGILIIEDLVAIVLMVAFSSIGQHNGGEDGLAIFFVVLKLVLFLILWFLIGIYVLPTFFRKTRSFLNSETLLIVSVGLCLGMVVLAVYSGFSTALGAFVMGSILAETVQAERIEKIFKPVKDLFGAIFFVSVGMMVNPSVIIEYGLPVLILSLVVIFGKVIFGATGALVAGQPLKISMQVGFSLSQIGEFSFIIASLGVSLSLIDSFLYPVAVAVSVITTFTTPYVMRLATPAYERLYPKLPEKWKIALYKHSEKANRSAKKATSIWNDYLKSICLSVAIYSAIVVGVLYLSSHYLSGFISDKIQTVWGNVLTAVITFGILAPVLRQLAVKKINAELFQILWKEGKNNRFLLIFIIVNRILLAFGFILIIIKLIFSFDFLTCALIAAPLLALTVFSRKVSLRSRKIEKQFHENLNSRQELTGYKREDLLHDLHLVYVTVSPNSVFTGKSLKSAHVRRNYGINIVSIVRGNEYINIPGGDDVIYPYDKIGVIGTDEQIEKFSHIIELHEEISGYNRNGNEVVLEHFTVSEDSFLFGKTVEESDVREKLNCLIIAIERADGTFIADDSQADFRVNDVVWIVGERQHVNVLKELGVKN